MQSQILDSCSREKLFAVASIWHILKQGYDGPKDKALAEECHLI